MDYYIFFALVCVILVASMVIGKQSSQDIKTNEDYFLSGRNLSVFKVAMTILATQLGGGAIIGTAEAAYRHGWYAVSYSAGISIGLVALSLGIGAKFREMNLSTVPQIFDDIYRSTTLRKLSSILYIISMFLILIAIGVSARKFALAVGFNSEWVFIAFWLVIIGYTATGGLTAVTKTDILQIIFVLGSFIITAFYLYFTNHNPVIDNQVVIDTTETNVPWITWLIAPCFFAIIGQDMAQRCFASKTADTISYAAIIAAVFLLIASILPTYLGVTAYEIGFEPINGSSVLIDIVKKLTNPYVTSIFACSILMALLSTADSLLCAISSNVVLDFCKPTKSPSTKAAKLITIIIGLGAMILSYFGDNIIQIMIFSYEISISALFIPVIMALLIDKPSKTSGFSSSFFGITAFILLYIFEYSYSAIYAICLSFAVFIVTESIVRITR